jgi:hypothetical protein
MDRALSEYRVLLFRGDGELSAVTILSACGSAEPIQQAQELVSRKIPKAEVWLGAQLIDTVYAKDGVILLWKKKSA